MVTTASCIIGSEFVTLQIIVCISSPNYYVLYPTHAHSYSFIVDNQITKEVNLVREKQLASYQWRNPLVTISCQGTNQYPSYMLNFTAPALIRQMNKPC